MSNTLATPCTFVLAFGLLATADVVQAADVNDGDDLQAAIDAASGGDTITVGPGTYDPIVIAKELFLRGAQSGVDACGRDSASETVITNSGTLLELKTGSAGTVIDGFEFSAGTKQIESTSGPIDDIEILNNRFGGFSGSAVFLNDSGADITVDQNSIDGGSQTGGGGVFHLDQDSFDGFHFTNNCVSDGATGFFVDGTRNVGTSGSRAPFFSGNMFVGNGTGVNFGRKAVEFATISSNIFSSNDFDGMQGGPKGSTITQNSFTGNGRSGLALTGFGGGGDATRGAQDNTISQNCFLGNLSEGVFFSSSQAANTISTNSLEQNNISANGDGAFYEGTETIDAEDNWWGAADGPSGDGTGGGDSVDGASGGGEIDFDPFLTAPITNTPCIGAQVTICHKSGTPAEKTKVVPAAALNGHLGHGDTLGACDS